MGNARIRPAIYNPSTGTYTTAPLATTSANNLKSKHLPVTPPVPDIDMLDEADELDPDATTTQKPTLDEDRTFTVRKWVPLPTAIADKRPEPKYLADRRPGLQSLYGQGAAAVPAYVPTGNTFTYTNADGGVSSTGLSLDDTSALGSRASVGEPVETPRRRGPPPPPKRKKKGGIGRRKKVQIEAPSSEQTVVGMDGTSDGAQKTEGDKIVVKTEEDGDAKDEAGEDDEGSGSDDEGEGSEEGEIDEGDAAPVLAVPTATDAATSSEIIETPIEALCAIPDVEVTQHIDLSMPEPVEEIPKIEDPDPSITGPLAEAHEGQIVAPEVAQKNELVEEKKPLAKANISEEIQIEQSMAPTAHTVTSATGALAVPEVDLLGSLDLAVQDMQGKQDTMDVSTQKPEEEEPTQ